MQFYSWQKFQPVGSTLVEPKWIQWDPDVTVAALAYPDSLLLCRLRPTFKPLASLSIQVRLPVAWLRSRTMQLVLNAKFVTCDCMHNA